MIACSFLREAYFVSSAPGRINLKGSLNSNTNTFTLSPSSLMIANDLSEISPKYLDSLCLCRIRLRDKQGYCWLPKSSQGQ